jgi:hypothetical protein
VKNKLNWLIVVLLMIESGSGIIRAQDTGQYFDISAAQLEDKIRGGLLGHLLGDLNGLKHEMQYIAEPGNITEYVPALPNGAWADDDTDLEWVYVAAMQNNASLFLRPQQISQLWLTHINHDIWCANEYARALMDLGISPPDTGALSLNPWADFNISGQFVSESWGLISPGMPITAARIGLNYTKVAISGEPAQATQLFDTMIATAFVTSDTDKIIDAGLAAVDPNCVVRQVVSDVRAWYKQNPNDWRATRRLVKEKYTRFNGEMRDRNGFELNTASVISALLYGRGDYIKTSIIAFNFGWDADCDAATACTIVGVQNGCKWMMSQGWDIKDEYRNTTRDNMPVNETITGFGDRLIMLAQRNITEHGGAKINKDGKILYRIQIEHPANIELLPDRALEFARLREVMKSEVEEGILRGASEQQRARAAYVAICLDLASFYQQEHTKQWNNALGALGQFPRILKDLKSSTTPAAAILRQKAKAAGLNL